MDDNDRYLPDVNKDNLSRVIGFASTYDSKANFALTVILALTAYLIAELPSYIDAHARHPQNTWFALMDLAAIGCLGFFLWAVVLIVLTIRPNVAQHSQKASPLFFQSIASTPLDDFKKKMASLEVDEVLSLLAEQTYDNAKVVATKHARVHEVINRFFWGVLCFLVFTIGRSILLALIR
jgi:Family of unknown function (DUF5706)